MAFIRQIALAFKPYLALSPPFKKTHREKISYARGNLTNIKKKKTETESKHENLTTKTHQKSEVGCFGVDNLQNYYLFLQKKNEKLRACSVCKPQTPTQNKPCRAKTALHAPTEDFNRPHLSTVNVYIY